MKLIIHIYSAKINIGNKVCVTYVSAGHNLGINLVTSLPIDVGGNIRHGVKILLFTIWHGTVNLNIQFRRSDTYIFPS